MSLQETSLLRGVPSQVTPAIFNAGRQSEASLSAADPAQVPEHPRQPVSLLC
jgi:hypothetical protein